MFTLSRRIRLSHRKRSALQLMNAALSTIRQRKHLSELDARMLRDVGLNKDDAEREGSRPIWDIPDWWR